MAVVVEDKGTDNVFVGPEELRGKVVFRGSGARVEFGEGSHGNVQIGVGHRARARFGRRTRAPALQVHMCDDAVLTIGDGVRFTWSARFRMHEPAPLTMGDDCMVAADLEVSVSDMHPIFDKASGQRINPARPVTIGNHVWLGENVLILKGANIGDGAVIGARSLVTGRIDEECLAVGSPARVLRRGITWGWNL